jgi:hypothetical protein
MKIYFWIFFEILFYFSKFWRKPSIFNTGSVFYSVSLQPDIIQNSWKNMRGTRKYFKMPLGKFEFFSSLFIYIYIYISWVGLNLAIRLGWNGFSPLPTWSLAQPSDHVYCLGIACKIMQLPPSCGGGEREACLTKGEKVLVAFLVVQGSLACDW